MLVVTKIENKILFLIFAIWIYLNPIAPACATELYDRYFSVRAMGMGNAYTPLASGLDAIFYNPSGLALNRGIDITLVKLRLGVNTLNPMDTYNNVKDFNSDPAGTLNNLYGKNVWADAGFMTGVTLPSFAAALYDSMNLSSNLSNPALPSFQVDAINDTGAATGFGFELAPGFRWGVSAKEIYRAGGSLTLPVSSIATMSGSAIKSQLENYGTGYSLDTGMALSLPTPVKPTFSFVWKDVGDTSFSLVKGINDLPRDPNNLIGAFSLEIDGPLFKIIPVVEMTYINDASIQNGKKINVGAELQLPVFSVRGGFHQGYWTMGAGMDLGIGRIDVASYGVELGVYPGQMVDRRYVLELTIDLGFDPSLSSFFGGGGGSGDSSYRGIKERR